MRRFFFAVALLAAVGGMAPNAFAIKQFNDVFKKMYAGDEAKEEFKKLVAEAKCNVCHVNKENKKKVRNPYGEALHEIVEDEKFPVKEFKKDPEKYADEIEAIFKKLEKQDSGYEKLKTFGARMEANKLPGGNTEGKKDE